jgi:hypothetical protein
MACACGGEAKEQGVGVMMAAAAKCHAAQFHPSWPSFETLPPRLLTMCGCSCRTRMSKTRMAMQVSYPAPNRQVTSCKSCITAHLQPWHNMSARMSCWCGHVCLMARIMLEM